MSCRLLCTKHSYCKSMGISRHSTIEWKSNHILFRFLAGNPASLPRPVDVQSKTFWDIQVWSHIGFEFVILDADVRVKILGKSKHLRNHIFVQRAILINPLFGPRLGLCFGFSFGGRTNLLNRVRLCPPCFGTFGSCLGFGPGSLTFHLSRWFPSWWARIRFGSNTPNFLWWTFLLLAAGKISFGLWLQKGFSSSTTSSRFGLGRWGFGYRFLQLLLVHLTLLTFLSRLVFCLPVPTFVSLSLLLFSLLLLQLVVAQKNSVTIILRILGLSRMGYVNGTYLIYIYIAHEARVLFITQIKIVNEMPFIS